MPYLNSVTEFLQFIQNRANLPKQNDVDLRLESLTLSAEEIEILVKALKSSDCPHKLVLLFNLANLETFIAVVRALGSDQCPSGLIFRLTSKEDLIDTVSIDILHKFLQNVHFPHKLELSFFDGYSKDKLIGNAGARALATLLESGYCPQGMRLNVSTFKITTEGAKALVNALESGHCPQGLVLDFSHNAMDLENIKALANALESGHCPQGLVLNFHYNLSTISPESIEALAHALESGKCPLGLQLNLSSNQICKGGDIGVIPLARALESGKCPQGLVLNLSSNEMGPEPLAQALKSGQCPRGLQLLMGKNCFDDNDAHILASALESGQCPDGLQLNFTDSKIGINGAKVLADALKSGQCPRGLQLIFDHNYKISDQGAKVLANALESGRCPKDLVLGLVECDIGDAGAKLLTSALQSGACPQGLRLSLAGNNICLMGVNALVNSLKTGRCPERLHVYLAQNPYGMIVSSLSNKMGSNNAKTLAKVLKSGHCPQGLVFELPLCEIDVAAESELAEAWKLYKQKGSLQCFALQQGHRQLASPFSQLPQDILNMIYDYLAPTTPIVAKMIEISAKVFCYQSSNKKLSEAKELKDALVAALSEPSISQRAEKIKVTTQSFLEKTLGDLEKGAFVKSPAIELLCKYHLIAGQKIIQHPEQPDHFQLSQQSVKRLKH